MNSARNHTEPAVLLIVFNRPDATQQTFNAIRAVRPARLYIACDGPRETHPDDVTNVRNVQAIVTSVDWPCEVNTLFRTSNRGCRRGPAEAIDWFFETENEGIILEDDCVPSPDFFAYCTYMLDTYREDKNIWHIGGNNFGWQPGAYGESPDSHYFGSLAQVWGWATWRDRWQQCEQNPFYLEDNLHLDAWNISRLNKLNKLAHIELLKAGLDAWDYQWQITILNHGGLVVYPRNNLITNVGDGPSATHTYRDDGRMHQAVGSWTTPGNLPEVARDRRLDSFFAGKMGLNRLRGPVAVIKQRALLGMKNLVYRMTRALMSRRDYSIVVASTGRAASTMLFDTIAASWAENRRPGWLQLPNILLAASIKQNFWRLADRGYSPGIIYKSHDAPPANIHKLAKVKFIFVYGDPLESALSVLKMTHLHGEIWLDQHLYHLSGHGNPHDLIHNDTLNYEKLLSSWLPLNGENVLTLDYADLWDKQDTIERFVGFSVALPEKRSRDKHEKSELPLDDDLYTRLKSSYANMRDHAGTS